MDGLFYTNSIHFIHNDAVVTVKGELPADMSIEPTDNGIRFKSVVESEPK
jgi:hypothetical protein